jgi:hypothetical protein
MCLRILGRLRYILGFFFMFGTVTGFLCDSSVCLFFWFSGLWIGLRRDGWTGSSLTGSLGPVLGRSSLGSVQAFKSCLASSDAMDEIGLGKRERMLYWMGASCNEVGRWRMVGSALFLNTWLSGRD